MNDVAEDFRQIKISRLTLGLIMSVAITSGVVVWNAAQVAGRIGDLEHTVQVIERRADGADAAVLARLDALETQISNIAPVSTDELEEDIIDLEEQIEELERRLDEDVDWQFGDLWWRVEVVTEALRTRGWGEDFLNEHLGPQGW